MAGLSKAIPSKPVKEPTKEPAKAPVKEPVEKKVEKKEIKDPLIRFLLGVIALVMTMYILLTFIGKKPAREEPPPTTISFERGEPVSRDIDVSGCRSFKLAMRFASIENVERIEVHGFTQHYSTLISLFSKPMPEIKYEVDTVINFYRKVSAVFIPVQGNVMKVDGQITTVCIQ